MTGTSLIHIMFAFPSRVPPEIYLIVSLALSLARYNADSFVQALPQMIAFVEHTK